MSKIDKNKMVPELRFLEFRKTEGWNQEPFSKLATFKKGKGISKLDIVKNGAIPCIRYGELYTHYKEIIDTVVSYTNINSTELVLSQPNDVIIPASGETKEDIATASCVLKGGIALGGDLNIIRTNVNGVFLSYYLNNVKKEEIAQLAQGYSVVHLYSDQLKKLIIHFPKPVEQQKIADCLSSLDELITTQNQKLEAFKAHKKGLLQNLFPVDGETIPQFRFPEFEDDGDWIEKSLGQVVHYENGKAHEQDIDAQGDYIVVNSKFISTDGEVKKYTNIPNLIANKDDILMVLSDVPNGRAIAKCFIVDKDNTYTVNQRICKLTSKKAVSLVLYYLINRNSYFLAFDDGAKQTNLRKDDVLNCPLFLPKNPKEQQKIADCLSSIDELINSQSQKIEELKAHKKGLMQQLFPNTNEFINE